MRGRCKCKWWSQQAESEAEETSVSPLRCPPEPDTAGWPSSSWPPAWRPWRPGGGRRSGEATVSSPTASRATGSLVESGTTSRSSYSSSAWAPGASNNTNGEWWWGLAWLQSMLLLPSGCPHSSRVVMCIKNIVLVLVYTNHYTKDNVLLLEWFPLLT